MSGAGHNGMESVVRVEVEVLGWHGHPDDVGREVIQALAGYGMEGRLTQARAGYSLTRAVEEGHARLQEAGALEDDAEGSIEDKAEAMVYGVLSRSGWTPGATAEGGAVEHRATLSGGGPVTVTLDRNTDATGQPRVQIRAWCGDGGTEVVPANANEERGLARLTVAAFGP